VSGLSSPYYQPLDLRCPECHAPPGTSCYWRDASGRPTFRRPHAARVTAARDASARRPPELRLRSRSAPPPPPGGSRS
jgi:hypothetical protein